MKTLGGTSLALSVIAVIASIWTPYHWQSGLTALVFLLAGAALLGTNTKE